MVVLDEKAAVADEETDSSKPSTLDALDMNNVGDNDSADPGKPVQGMTDDQYPHGFKLVLLAGASLVAVFFDCVGPSEYSTRPCRPRRENH